VITDPGLLVVIILLNTLIACSPGLRRRKLRPDRENPVSYNADGSQKLNLLPRLWFTDLFLIAQSVLGGSIVSMWFYAQVENGKTHLDSEMSRASQFRIAAEFFVYFFAFDFYYYLLHRFFLHGPLGWWIHNYHHTTVVTGLGTAFTFHFIEALITGGFPLALAYFFGAHQQSLVVINTFGTINSILVHAGYALYPSWWNLHPVTKWWLDTQFHDVHHQKINCNYGAFLTFWDHMFRTVHPKFTQMAKALHQRVSGSLPTTVSPTPEGKPAPAAFAAAPPTSDHVPKDVLQGGFAADSGTNTATASASSSLGPSHQISGPTPTNPAATVNIPYLSTPPASLLPAEPQAVPLVSAASVQLLAQGDMPPTCPTLNPGQLFVKGGGVLELFAFALFPAFLTRCFPTVWVSFEGKARDVSAFVARHPGGEQVLRGYAGRDITEIFKDVGHSERALELLSECPVVGSCSGWDFQCAPLVISKAGAANS